MSYLWGMMMILIGLFVTISGTIKSDFIVYRMFVARSKIMWGDHVHRFYQVVGIVIMIFGAVIALGYV